MKIFFFYISLLGSIIFIITIAVCSIPDNVIQNNYNINNGIINNLFPQGWGFFTKSPRLDRVYLYKVNDNDIQFYDNKNTQFVNWYGIKKANRQILQTISKDLDNLPSRLWYSSTDPATFKLWSKINVINIEIDNPSFPKGLYLVELIPPLPWAAFSEKNNKLKLKRKYIGINAK